MKLQETAALPSEKPMAPEKGKEPEEKQSPEALKETLVDAIIALEWEMFQEVQNIGGRADCQDDFETFSLMRRSQYRNWSTPMLSCYHAYAVQCRAEGWNLLTEKYGRMMRYTDPAYYDEYLATALPPVPAENRALIDEIVATMCRRELDFVREFPRLAGAGRPVTAARDDSDVTSQESYERGELETYPRELLLLYAEYLRQLEAQGKSLPRMIHETVVHLYGYRDLQEAEDQLKATGR